GSEHLASAPEGANQDVLESKVMEAVRAAFRPEFLNRLDEMLVFHRLRRDQMADIVKIQLKHLEALLADRHVSLDLDEPALEWLAAAGYDPAYGARPLKRVIQRTLQNPLAERILAGDIHDGDTVRVSVDAMADQLAIEPVHEPV
ncbi:MAG: ATP-dependent chaperone ClpB, partial [Alphaproteobacteria bacterium]|nr:ATP-dependent chaperone ClpB [Alphaproteobacteria bacterium]